MLATRARKGLVTVALFAAVLVACFILDQLSNRYFTRLLSVDPRDIDGLDGIVFAPLLHADAAHLTSNIFPLVIFGFLAFLDGARRFTLAVAMSWGASGLGAWLFGFGPTIGASGVIFGLFTYLLARGFYNRNWKQIALAAVLFLVYGSILWGVLPLGNSGISWQAHLFGAMGGLGAAVVLRQQRRHTQRAGTTKGEPTGSPFT
ncbi:rhomboid family intramembrane serine protease [Arthrobacter roseus]|uniref:rhomboid family intramembrane serine protease n=1 Tax=Arthrobacter roseus TaxID=136274 RepID=UPI001962D87D|nr:rhomboid family intramembrane serine protease [Arthrobacter roseus]MBM7847975.1 membrane associated rhomboid family serine protease [Arthrobacter roseus]